MKVIEIDVEYGGDFKKHKFQLKTDPCRESFPVQCDAKLIDLIKDDRHAAFIHNKIPISLHEARLDNDYYDNVSMNIQGVDNNSKVLLILSEKKCPLKTSCIDFLSLFQ